MNLRIKGSHITSNDKGLVVKNGSRTLLLLGTSAAQMSKAQGYIANLSFGQLYKSAHPAGRKNARYIKISN